MLEPFAGIQFNSTSSTALITPILSWVGGFQYGIRGGERGAIVIDLRVVGDIGSTNVDPPIVAGDGTHKNVDRFQIAFTIGYKIGFYNRNKEEVPIAPAGGGGY
jgi:hypothetical protein